MSGRKASEVNSLLRNSEKTRSGAIRNLEEYCNNAKKDFECAKIKIEEVEKKIARMQFSISEDCIKEFPEASKKLLEQIEKYKSENNYEKIEYNYEKYDDIMSEYKVVDSEADCVRIDLNRKIQSQRRNDPWYCDEEYDRAQNVQNKYKALSVKVQELSSESGKVITKSKTAIKSAEERLKQGNNLSESIADLERKAKQVKELREKADEAKKTIQKEYDTIDKMLAEKFIQEKYINLNKLVEKACVMQHEELINNCTDIISKISEVKNELIEIYGNYVKRKGEVEQKRDSLKERITHEIYSHPEDEFKKGKFNKNSLINFLIQYGDKKYVEDIQIQMDCVNKAIRTDQFEEADKILEDLENLISEASGYAVKIHENKMKTIFNMLTIEKAMLELNYDVKVSTNYDEKDGYCIECTAGDECIKFDRVTVVGDGQVIIDIDHKEDTKGSCGDQWHRIRQKLSEESLFIEDIKKNGKSIHPANAEQKHNRVSFDKVEKGLN